MLADFKNIKHDRNRNYSKKNLNKVRKVTLASKQQEGENSQSTTTFTAHTEHQNQPSNKEVTTT